jgi:DegV family protein with EDD domain
MNEQRIAVITDSGTDTPADFVAAHDVRVIPLRINYSDGSSYENGVDITTEDVVRRFDEEIPSTSLPSPMKIRDTFEQARRDGYVGAVVVTISSGLSATNETMNMVARQMEDFPVVVVDTKSIGVAAGLVVMEAVRQVEAGMPLDRIGSVLGALSERTRVYFSVQKLDFLRKGGRISEAVYRVGSVLNIKPVLMCDEREGKYVIAKKARGWQRALDTQVKLLVENAARWGRVRLAVCTFDPALRGELVARVRERVGAVAEIVEFVSCGISADLLVHTGPTLVGMAVQGV